VPRAALIVLALVVLLPGSVAVAAPSQAAAELHFEQRVRPLLVAHCHKCHGPTKASGGLRLDSAAAVARGGDAGPVVVPGKPDDSRLIAAVRHTGRLKMPPRDKLNDRQVADLVSWVRAGAFWPGAAASEPRSPQQTFWAFQPVRDPPLPSVKDATWPRTPIDRFLLARLESAHLAPAPPASRDTLLRRLTFDLTGLPPTPEEVEAFAADTRPDAYERLVDRLLASPEYGERWGRHWLDVVRYADTTANDANAVMRYAYRYRDYVAEALNADRPYDQFVVEQLAGDLLEVGAASRAAPAAPLDSRGLQPVGVASRAAPLPLRLGAPDLPSSDDVALRTRRVIATGFLMLGPKALAETDKEQARLDIVDEQIDVTSRAFLGLTISCARCHDHKFDPIPTADYYALAGIFRSTEPFRDEVPTATMWQEWPLPQGPGRPPLLVMAPREGRPVDLRIHRRGNRHTLGERVPRRFPHALTPPGRQPSRLQHSGRLELARWIASGDNPLTARVLVNRLWQHHFGIGLVATSDNLGRRGARPSHPGLLDWLAWRFVHSGWSIKAMHRLIVLSSAYRMSSRRDDRALAIDPDNRLLWRMPLRRLDAEAIRDAMLAVAGRLDRTIGGNESSEFLYREGEVIDRKRDFFRPNQVRSDHAFYTQSRRRSLYLPVVRNALPDVLALFDAADANAVTAQRNETTTPAQALFLLNHPFVRAQARGFATRVRATSRSDAARIHQAYRLALGRPARDAEVASGVAFLKRYQARAVARGRKPSALADAWQSYCQVLLCGNEFLYVE
jgi:cytochrome c553